MEQFFEAASETRGLKHMYQMRNRDSLCLDFEKVLTSVNRGHH